MASRKQIRHPKKEEKKAEVEVKANPGTTEKGEKLKKDIDDVLDKIDNVLNENAEEFVKNYVQKGGE